MKTIKKENDMGIKIITVDKIAPKLNENSELFKYLTEECSPDQQCVIIHCDRELATGLSIMGDSHVRFFKYNNNSTILI